MHRQKVTTEGGNISHLSKLAGNNDTKKEVKELPPLRGVGGPRKPLI